jgi:hypothetical protein
VLDPNLDGVRAASDLAGSVGSDSTPRRRHNSVAYSNGVSPVVPIYRYPWPLACAGPGNDQLSEPGGTNPSGKDVTMATCG